MLEVTRLRVLVAVARHGSVTAAARSLNYAQPSVSHHLARLEAETGAQLIQRSGRSVRLTDAGRLLAERAEEILGRLEAAENELAAQVGQRAQRIRLAAFTSALATFVPAAAARLRAAHPGTELVLMEAEPAEAVRLLRAGQADVALACRYLQDGEVVYQPGLPAESARARLILTEPVLLVTGKTAAGQLRACPPGRSQPGQSPAGRSPASQSAPVQAPSAQAPSAQASSAQASSAQAPSAQSPSAQAPSTQSLAAQGPSAQAQSLAAQGPSAQALTAQSAAAGAGLLTALARCPWIAGCEESRGYLRWVCAQAGFSPKIAVTTDDHVAAQAMAAAGLGVAVLPELALRAARHPGVQTQPLPGASRQVLALTFGDPPDLPAAGHLLDALGQMAASRPCQ